MMEAASLGVITPLSRGWTGGRGEQRRGGRRGGRTEARRQARPAASWQRALPPQPTHHIVPTSRPARTSCSSSHVGTAHLERGGEERGGGARMQRLPTTPSPSQHATSRPASPSRAHQQSPASICKAFTPRCSLKKPIVPQYVPQELRTSQYLKKGRAGGWAGGRERGVSSRAGLGRPPAPPPLRAHFMPLSSSTPQPTTSTSWSTSVELVLSTATPPWYP